MDELTVEGLTEGGPHTTVEITYVWHVGWPEQWSCTITTFDVGAQTGLKGAMSGGGVGNGPTQEKALHKALRAYEPVVA